MSKYRKRKLSRPEALLTTEPMRVHPDDPEGFLLALTEDPAFKPQALYRFWDAEGSLLYVGVSNFLTGRFKGHARRSVWWPDIATLALETYATRRDVLDAEHRAILREGPIFNRTLNENGFMWTTREAGYLRGAH